MKLLFLVPSFPYPPRAGYELITYQHVKFLAQHHSIDMIAFDLGDKKPDMDMLKPYCRNIEMVRITPRQSRLNKCLGLVTGASLHASAFKSSEMSKRIRKYVSDYGYDVIIFQTTLMAQYLPKGYQGATVLNMIDPLVLNLRRSLQWKPWHIRPWALYKINRLQHYEMAYSGRFDRVVLINQADVSDYQTVLKKANFDWTPHTVDVELLPSKSVTRHDGAIVISGMMDHPPNVDAVQFFCGRIFPIIQKEIPNATLSIVGSNPGATVKKWASVEQIHVTGSVPDIRPYLNEAMVSICPVRLKVGTQTKILEAMAAGTPVVTTTEGNYGVGGVSGEHLYVADEPVEFAKCVIGLLRGENWERIAANGRHFVCDNFSAEKSGAKFENILAEVSRGRIQ